MKRKTLFAACAVLNGCLLIAAAAAPIIHSQQAIPPQEIAPSTAQSSAQPIVTLPFELANRHIVLKVQVNNSRPLAFVLDTGDKYAIIDLDRARELGLKLGPGIRMGGAGAETSMGYFVSDSTFTIAGFPGFSQPMSLALPIARLSSRMGQDFDGIIGHDFIKNFVVEIDYQTRVIKLHDKDKFSYAGPGESIPIRINGAGHPIVDAAVTPLGSDPVKAKFVVDIGSGLALALHSPFVNERKLLGPNVKTIRVLGAAGAGGATNGQFGRVTELKLGSYRIKNPITLLSEDTAGAFANTELAGNIGAQVMNKFRVWLDYSHDRIILEPNSNFDKPYDRSFSGLSIHAEGKDYRTFRVVAVLENSPGAETGFQKDDIVTAINDRPASELTLSTLNEMFELPVPYELTIRRGEQILKLKLTPRRLV